MSEIDLVLVNETDNCTIYTLQFEGENETEFESFYNKFKDDAVYNCRTRYLSWVMVG